MLFRIGYVSGAITTEMRPLNVFQCIPCDQKLIPKWLERNRNTRQMKKRNHSPSIHLRRSVINFYHFEIVQIWFDGNSKRDKSGEWKEKIGKDENIKKKKSVKSIRWQLLNNSELKFVSVLIDFQVLRFIFRLFFSVRNEKSRSHS